MNIFIMNLLMIIVNLSVIQQHVYASYHSKISTKLQQQSYQDQLSSDSTKQESHDVMSSTVTNNDVSSSIVTNSHIISSSSATNHNVSSSYLTSYDDDASSVVATYHDISAASTTEVTCISRFYQTCDSCISSKNSTGKGSFQYCQKNGYCYELHQNYTSLCQAQCGSSTISATHDECADFQRISAVVLIIYIILLIVCPLLLILSFLYLCILRCRALLLNKIHAGNDDDDTPVRLIQLYNSAPTSSDNGVVHPTTAVRVSGDNSSDEYVVYAQAEIDVDDDDGDNNRSGRVKIYRGYDLHTV